ncbi:MAG: ROK family protein [Clostridia bacterium]|nr:ROK family protein [Clostridia bacterium]
MKRVLGLDIGGTKCAVLLADCGEEISVVEKIRFDTRTDLGFEYAKEKLLAAASELIGKSEIPVQAIGVSCGGPLNSRKGVVQSPPNLPGWDDIPIVGILEEAFGIPAFLQNDANACGLVEWKYGAGRGTQDMVFLTMGTGMGAGVIADGRLLRGSRDMAGEVGHLRLEHDGPVGYGKAGSFEGFSSGGGIGRLACMMRREWQAHGETVAWTETDEEFSTKALAGYANAGDHHALCVFETAGDYLGQGIAMIADVLNPEMVVIGGVYMRCEHLIKDSMWKAIRREALRQCWQDLQVVPAQTSEQIGDFAAAMVAVYGLEMGK